MTMPFLTACRRPLLIVEFARDQTLLSWAMTRPGFRVGRRVAWLEVRNDELPAWVDPFAFLEERMEAAGLPDAIALMTSRDIRRHHLTQSVADGVTATCLATVGLSNAVHVAAPRLVRPAATGTINLLVHVSQPLSEAAMIETVSIASEARTVALLATDYRPGGSPISGTGTDCIVVAAPAEGAAARFAGLHTAIGQAVGSCVHAAVTEGAQVWLLERSASAFSPEP